MQSASQPASLLGPRIICVRGWCRRCGLMYLFAAHGAGGGRVESNALRRVSPDNAFPYLCAPRQSSSFSLLTKIPPLPGPCVFDAASQVGPEPTQFSTGICPPQGGVSPKLCFRTITNQSISVFAGEGGRGDGGKRGVIAKFLALRVERTPSCDVHAPGVVQGGVRSCPAQGCCFLFSELLSL